MFSSWTTNLFVCKRLASSQGRRPHQFQAAGAGGPEWKDSVESAATLQSPSRQEGTPGVAVSTEGEPKLGVAALEREPWPLAMPRRGGLEGAACAEDGEFVKRLSNELQAYGQMVLPEATGDGKRGQPSQVRSRFDFAPAFEHVIQVGLDGRRDDEQARRRHRLKPFEQFRQLLLNQRANP